MLNTGSPRPKAQILLLINEWNWAFHTIVRAIERQLGDYFSFTILSVNDKPFIDDNRFDIIHVLFETETYHRNFLRGHAKILKGVYSHYWALEGKNADTFYDESLYEAHAVAVPSLRLFRALSGIPCPLYLFPEGVDTDVFRPVAGVNRTAAVAWAGSDFPIKRLDVLREACDGLLPLHTAMKGQLPEQAMPAFFSAADIVACASVAEGCPRPILEGMACGAFPVSTDVGIVRELIRHKENGYIVDDATPHAFREAFLWCADHPEILERARAENRELICATRQWSSTVQPLHDIYDSLITA